jgi:MoxR-like ATPase
MPQSPQVQRAPFPFDRPQSFVERIVRQAGKVIVGKREIVETAVIAFLGGGHLLLEDVPGVGKTTLVRALAKILGASFKRIQCTPDLLPTDITGVSVFNQKTGEFEFRPGPIMANIVLADEINRASPKTQAALLEAMEERQVTVDGVTYRLPEPFFVLATQNPVEQEGTFALPEAQLDRFFVKIRLGYPDENDEVEMLDRLQERVPLEDVKPALVPEELLRLQAEVRTVFLDDSLKRYIVRLTAATRRHPDVALGASPRASFALMRAAQAMAFARGRTYVVPDDVKAMAVPTIAHRLSLAVNARLAGKTAEAVLSQLLSETPVPAAGSERYGWRPADAGKPGGTL